MKPKVSIIIPVYNGADFLDEAIDSALDQTYPNIEIVVVNDGSDDDGATERMALRYGERIRYFAKPNGGVASALNFAIREMRGDYFSWLSHDDLYDQRKVEREIEALPDGNRTIIYSDHAVFTNDPQKTIPVRLKGVPPEQFRYWITVENALHGCTLLIPRQAFAECGVFDERLRTTQDYDLWFRLAEKYRFVHLPAVLVKARSHPDQGSIRLAGTALTESDALLTGFVQRLTGDDLAAATPRAVAVAHADIATSMCSRGFANAARMATGLALRGLAGAPPADKLRTIGTLALGMLRCHAARSIRAILPRGLGRRRVKNLLWRIRHSVTVRHIAAKDVSLKRKFSEIYDRNIFGGRHSRSGAGSDPDQTVVIRRELPRLLKHLQVRSLLDAPCGDWHWIRQIDLGVETYIGVDIVEELITTNRRRFASGSVSFQCLDLGRDSLPEVDLILSRDCLVHLTLADALRIIANFKRSGSRYLLTTTFVDRYRNDELSGRNAFWRPLNMELPPFNFPPPLMLVNESCTEEHGLFADKCLGLWRLCDIECKAPSPASGGRG